MSKRRGLAWGARNIGKEIDRSERQTHHLLETRQIKCAFKKGALWVAPLAGLDEEFYGEPSEAAEDDAACGIGSSTPSNRGGNDR